MIYNSPAPTIKPSEKDFVAKIPIWVILIIGYVCMTFGSWFSDYTSISYYASALNGSMKAETVFYLVLFLGGLLSLVIAYVVAYFINSLITSFSRGTLKIPKNTVIGVFIILRSFISLITGAIGFYYITNPLQYALISNIISILSLFVYSIGMYYYLKMSYSLNSLCSALLIRSIFIPFSVYAIVIIFMGALA